MSPGHRLHALRHSRIAAAALLALAAPFAGQAADTDIYGPTGSGSAPNVVFLLDNTSNWSTNNQNWNSGDSWDRCKSLAEPARTQCQNLIEAIYYAGIPTSGGSAKKRPWDSGYNNNANKDGVHPTQGQLQLRALKLVLNSLVCSGAASALKVNVGVSMIGDSGSTLSTGHASGFIRFAVQPLTGTAATSGSSCKALIDEFDKIDSKITDPTYKAPSNANYGAAMYEIFKYFGGHSNPTLAGNPAPNGGTPVGATGYGPVRYSRLNSLDDPAAFTDAGRSTYKSPITAAESCGNNYIVLVGNTYPNFEPNNGGPTIFQGIGYTPPTLSALSSDTSRYADEWAYFLANTDVSLESGVQRIFTYAVNTYKDKPDADQGKLLKSMAVQGGVGAAGYLEVGGDLVKLVETFKDILLNIAAVNSVFTATTLPVSTTTQGTFLNQIFVGMFRPDANAGPRWVGNLKQYQLGMVNGVLDLVDKNGKPAVLSGAGFFSPLAESFWTEDSVFFDASRSGTPPSASDRPDGPIVEKGGAAQQLRKMGAASRNIKVLGGSGLQDLPSNAAFSPFTLDEVKWIRGENNVATGPGAEAFNGSYSNAAGTTTPLGSTGARHSIHGDVLHSRPVALNYGSGDVVVYYGANDGFFRAVDGNKTGGTAGQELWSFIAPEHYTMMRTRLRTGTETIHLPETNSSGGTIAAPSGSAPKSYGMDGPIGVYARYSSGGGSVTQAIIYPTMRRGGQSVYAFDVTSKSAPALLTGSSWPITGGSGDYAKLAQTWSMPKPVVFSNSSVTAPILLMGGGYDPAEDTNNSSGIGNVVYVINGFTGARIAALPTDYSVPSDVTVVDVNGDGEPDRAYVADVRGNLYRIDFPLKDDVLDASKWTATPAGITKIAQLDGKVFFAPDVVVTKNFVAVLVGTGDREKPLLVSTSDNFFLIKDNVGEPRKEGVNPKVLTKSDLTRVAKIDNTTMTPGSPNPTSDPEGCYLELATNGEKVVNAPFTIAGATYFGTNRPKPASSTTCSADLGEAYAYKFPLFCGLPSKPNPIVGGGLPPSPVGGIVNMVVDGQNVKMPFIIGSGEGNSSFKPGEPKWPIPPVRSRLNWRIDNTNR
jgi:type IV pilus assembly protein PilY1